MSSVHFMTTVCVCVFEVDIWKSTWNRFSLPIRPVIIRCGLTSDRIRLKKIWKEWERRAAGGFTGQHATTIPVVEGWNWSLLYFILSPPRPTQPEDWLLTGWGCVTWSYTVVLDTADVIAVISLVCAAAVSLQLVTFVLELLRRSVDILCEFGNNPFCTDEQQAGLTWPVVASILRSCRQCKWWFMSFYLV